MEELLKFDRDHIWHPYSSATSQSDCLLVAKANGVYIELEDGKKLVDGMSSWWCTIHGYNVPELNDAIEAQVKDMSHVMFGGLTHKPAIELSKKLIDITPDGLEHIFYCDSGSVAVEVSMKMALQYWSAKKQGNKISFLTVRNGYHGDTWHTMSVCDPVTGMHNLFNNKLPNQIFLPAPKSRFNDDFDPAELEEVEAVMAARQQDIAAFILEPIVQGTGGMRFYHPAFLKGVHRLCKKYDVLLIADEIATGFGRTGKLFACEHANITPDILCIGKALTGGYMSFAATLCTKEVATTISSTYPGIFMHGPTFMGNPLACAVANASMSLLLDKNWKADIQRIEKHLNNSLPRLSALAAVEDVRVLGAIGVIELTDPVDMAWIQGKLIEQNIWLRPFGKLVYTMPPYIISDIELKQLTNAMISVLEDYNEFKETRTSTKETAI